MKTRLLSRNYLFVLALLAFIVIGFVERSILTSAYKGKEKDFNDKLFLVAPYVESQLFSDTAIMRNVTTDSAAIRFAQTAVKKRIDSFFALSSISLEYVYGVGKLKSRDEYYNNRIRFMIKPDLIWSSDPAENLGLTETRLGIAHIGPQGKDLYYVKIFLPSKPAYLIRQLTPMVMLSGLSILLLLVCFLVLMFTVRRQATLARIKEDFINNMTHELKTPLFTISIASKMLAGQESVKKDDKSVSYVDSIREETDRLNQLVDKVLETAALDKKQLRLKDEKLDVHEAIASVINSFEIIKNVQGAQISVSLHAQEHYIKGDKIHIMSAISSLLDNAIKYSKPPARITITSFNSGDQVMISVADKGIGFDMNMKNMLFDRFFRANTGDLHDVKGYGIGLSYAKAVTEVHNGHISVKSKVGEGSEFILSLPFLHG